MYKKSISLIFWVIIGFISVSQSGATLDEVRRSFDSGDYDDVRRRLSPGPGGVQANHFAAADASAEEMFYMIVASSPSAAIDPSGDLDGFIHAIDVKVAAPVVGSRNTGTEKLCSCLTRASLRSSGQAR